MPKEQISDEEFDRLEAEARHGDLIEAIRSIAPRDRDEGLIKLESLLVKQTEALLALINRKDFSTNLKPLITEISKKDFGTDIGPLITEIANGLKEIKEALGEKPRVFLIKRNGYGFIESVTVTERE